MVGDDAWLEAGAPQGCLCVGCLERRLGRELERRDFPALPVNGPHPTLAKQRRN
jgi:hypothetical protein